MAATACSVLSCSRGGRLGGELEGALNLVESLWRFAGDFLEWYGATAPDNRSPKSLRGLRSGGAQRVQIEHVHVNGRGRWITKDVQASADRPGNDRQVLEAVVSQSRSQRAAMTVKRPTASAYGSPPRGRGHPHQARSPNGSIAEAAAAMGVGARQIWGGMDETAKLGGLSSQLGRRFSALGAVGGRSWGFMGRSLGDSFRMV